MSPWECTYTLEILARVYYLPAIFVIFPHIKQCFTKKKKRIYFLIYVTSSSHPQIDFNSSQGHDHRQWCTSKCWTTDFLGAKGSYMYIHKLVINFTGLENVCLTIYKYEHNTQHSGRVCGSCFVLRGHAGWFLPNSLICSQPMGTVQPWFDKLSCIPVQFLLKQETRCSSARYVIYMWSTVKLLLTLKQVLLINESLSASPLSKTVLKD